MAYKTRVRTQEEVDKLRDKYRNSANEFKPLTQREKHFLFQLVYNCKEKWRAFEIAYPAPDGREYTREYCQSKALRVLNRPHVQRRFREMEEQMQNDLQQKGLWTREESVKYLRKLLDTNIEEQKRINETYNAQIDLLLLKIQEAKTPNEKEKLMEKVIEVRKKLRNNSVNNNAILSSIGELNKMHGYNSQEVVIKDGDLETKKLREKLSEIPTEDLLQQIKQMTENNG